MSRLTAKLIILLIVYFAGFATAIYLLNPAPQPAKGGVVQAGVDSSFASSQLIQTLNGGLHKAVDATKQAAINAGGYIQQKLNEKNQE